MSLTQGLPALAALWGIFQQHTHPKSQKKETAMLALMSAELSDLLKGQDLAKEHLNQAKGTELCPLMWRGCGQTGLL